LLGAGLHGTGGPAVDTEHRRPGDTDPHDPAGLVAGRRDNRQALGQTGSLRGLWTDFTGDLPVEENVEMETQMISSPIPIGKKTAPNRIVFQPMECNDADSSGDPSDLSINRYRRFAEGGAGIIFSESLTLTTESRARKSQMAVTEKNAEGLARLITAMREVNQDSLILFQLNQSGKLSFAGCQI
jgi:hypothetical protein